MAGKKRKRIRNKMEEENKKEEEKKEEVKQEEYIEEKNRDEDPINNEAFEEKKELNENEIKVEEEIKIEKTDQKSQDKNEIKILQKQNDMNEAPFVSNKIYYNCTKCSSNIEIISLDENDIKFKCNNNHNINISVKDYLKEMKKYNNIKLNDNKCDKHKEEYLSYCFDCNIHLCKECLRTGEHSYHYKIYIIEILPKMIY